MLYPGYKKWIALVGKVLCILLENCIFFSLSHSISYKRGLLGFCDYCEPSWQTYHSYLMSLKSWRKRAVLMLQGQFVCTIDNYTSPWRVIDSLMTFHCLAFVPLHLFTTAMEMKPSAKPLGSVLVHQFTHITEFYLCLYRELWEELFHSNWLEPVAIYRFWMVNVTHPIRIL